MLVHASETVSARSWTPRAPHAEHQAPVSEVIVFRRLTRVLDEVLCLGHRRRPLAIAAPNPVANLREVFDHVEAALGSRLVVVARPRMLATRALTPKKEGSKPDRSRSFVVAVRVEFSSSPGPATERLTRPAHLPPPKHPMRRTFPRQPPVSHSSARARPPKTSQCASRTPSPSSSRPRPRERAIAVFLSLKSGLRDLARP